MLASFGFGDFFLAKMKSARQVTLWVKADLAVLRKASDLRCSGATGGGGARLSPSTWKAEADGSLLFEASLVYTVSSRLARAI